MSRHVVVIGDTPRADEDPPACLSAHMDDATACAIPFVDAVDPAWTAGEAAVATGADAEFIDPTPWICQTDPCPAVIGRLLVFRDQHHLTATYARALAERLFARLPSIDLVVTRPRAAPPAGPLVGPPGQSGGGMSPKAGAEQIHVDRLAAVHGREQVLLDEVPQTVLATADAIPDVQWSPTR